MHIWKLVGTVAVATSFVACGGGGGENSVALSSTQTNFEAAFLTNTASQFAWWVPPQDTAPTDEVAYFFYEARTAIASSPRDGVVERELTFHNLSNLKANYDGTYSVTRVLKDGEIHYRDWPSKSTFTYSGDNVIWNRYSKDGSRLLYTTELIDITPSQALTGALRDSTAAKSYFSFFKLNTPTNFDFTVSWDAGSSYTLFKQKHVDETIFVWDWPSETRTYDANVSPYPGTEATIEKFADSLSSSGGLIFDGVTYTLSDGNIVNKGGVRMWVAKNKRPTSASPTTQYLCLIELNEKLYAGAIVPAGSIFRQLDAVDSTIVLENNMFLNPAAVQSVKNAIKF